MGIFGKIFSKFTSESEHGTAPARETIEPVFTESEYNRIMSKDGIVTFNWLTADEIDVMKETVKKVTANVDPNDVHLSTVFKVSAFSNDSVYKSNLFDSIYQMLAPKLDELMPDYVPLAINFFEKHPHQGVDSVPIHQNPSFVAEPEFKSFSIWIPLQDVDKENGTVGVLKGSHDKFNYMRASNMPNELVFKLVQKDLEEKYFEPVNLKVGEVLVLNDSIIHWSYPNVSDRERDAVQLVMVPKKTQHIYYFYHPNGKESVMDLYEVDKDYFFNSSCQVVPQGLKKIASLPFEYKEITEKQLRKHVPIK